MSEIRFPVSKPAISLADEVAVQETLRSQWITQGPRVQQFEEMFAACLSRKHAVACSNGTTALHLALLSLGIGPGDRVIVPDLTYVAAANAVRYCGAEPVFVDVDPITWCIDPTKIPKNRHIRAVVSVDLYGCAPVGLDAVEVPIVEDAAEGLGGSQYGLPLGTQQLLATFSFYGNKIITCGEGGMVVTNDKELDTRIRRLRGQGVDPTRRYFHTVVGYNYRMTEMQAALGHSQLSQFRLLHERRTSVMQAYRGLLSDIFTLPKTIGEQAPWLFTGLVPEGVDRDQLMADLLTHGIETRPTFVPMHRLPMYAVNRYDSAYPFSCRIADRGISLPTYPELTREDVNEIAAGVRRCVEDQLVSKTA